MVWIVDYEDMNSGDTATTVWRNEEAARKDVCANIINDINDGWDFSDQHSFDTAKQIEEAIQKKRYELAISLWNDWSSTYDAGIFWNVHEEMTHDDSSACTPGSIVWPDQDDDEVPATQPSGPFVATTPGATCRGPCGQWNEYAYADKADGTHVCYQCKTFNHIYGIKNP